MDHIWYNNTIVMNMGLKLNIKNNIFNSKSIKSYCIKDNYYMIPLWELNLVIFWFLYFIKSIGNFIGNVMGTINSQWT